MDEDDHSLLLLFVAWFSRISLLSIRPSSSPGIRKGSFFTMGTNRLQISVVF